MNSSAHLSATVENINKLAAALDAQERSYIFLDWNPLHNENDTAESKFWRECINIHILFRECMPGNLPARLDKSPFFAALGYTKEMYGNYRRFINMLRNLRLYRCHMLLDIDEHNKRKNDIVHFLGTDPALAGLTFKDWQLRAEAEDWQSACDWLYAEAQKQLSRLQDALTALQSDAQKALALQGWVALYARWYQNYNTYSIFLTDALVHRIVLMNESNPEISEDKIELFAAQRAKKILEGKIYPGCPEALTDEYGNMESYSSFEPAELSQQIVDRILPQFMY